MKRLLKPTQEGVAFYTCQHARCISLFVARTRCTIMLSVLLLVEYSVAELL